MRYKLKISKSQFKDAQILFFNLDATWLGNGSQYILDPKYCGYYNYFYYIEELNNVSCSNCDETFYNKNSYKVNYKEITLDKLKKLKNN